MPILCLGLSHQTAPIELRERLVYSTSVLKATLARCKGGPAGYSELALLSTCNRLELYAVAPTEQFDALVEILSETSGLPQAELESHLYRHAQAKAVIHLSRVAAGLDSMILGEPQILGQVAEAYQVARSEGMAGPILSKLFRTAIRAGKRARSETAISRNPASVGSVAVKLAEAVVGNLAAARALVLGAGEMAELMVEAFRVQGAGHIVVVSRTQARAVQLAQRWSAQPVPFESLAQVLADSDIVLAAAAAPHVLITPDLARAALARRLERPLVFIDIAVPRNVDPQVGDLQNVRCYNLDDLQTRLNGGMAERQQEIPHVEAIMAEEAAAFANWMRGLDIIPLITDLRVKADAIRRAEVEKTLRRLPRLDETEQQHIEVLTEALTNKLLHDLTVRLKAEAGNGRAAEYMETVRYLFNLNR
jgi:glutamyl-tRNA reductase